MWTCSEDGAPVSDVRVHRGWVRAETNDAVAREEIAVSRSPGCLRRSFTQHNIPCLDTAIQAKLEASLRKCACPSKDALSEVHMAARPFLCHQRAWRPLLWRRRRLPSTPKASLPTTGCAGVWVDYLATWGPPGDGTGPRGSRLVCPAPARSVVAVRMSGALVMAQPGGPNPLYVWTGEAVLGAS